MDEGIKKSEAASYYKFKAVGRLLLEGFVYAEV